jgi:hypothetical protein
MHCRRDGGRSPALRTGTLRTARDEDLTSVNAPSASGQQESQIRNKTDVTAPA